MTKEENVKFMNDPRRIEALKRLDIALARMEASMVSNGSAEYYLVVVRQHLRELEAAYENLTIVEATVQAEIEGKQRFHG